MSEEYMLKVYVAGLSPNHQEDIIRLKQAMKESLDDFTLQVIDVLEDPHLAEQDRILATPTVVRSLPDPIKKYIFDLGNIDNILVGMDLIKQGE